MKIYRTDTIAWSDSIGAEIPSRDSVSVEC
jgi:hypothetical protein